MRLELKLAGYDVNFVSVNKNDAASSQQKLLDRCKFTLLQDLTTVDVWSLQNGNKDDMYIYGTDGTLADYLPNGGERSTNLSTTDGYNAVKGALLDVLNSP